MHLDALRDHVFKALVWKCEAVLFAPSTGQMSSPKEHHLPDDCASRHPGEHFRAKLSFGQSSVGIRWVHKLVHYWSVRARWSKYQLLLDKLNSVFGKAWLCVCLGKAPYYKPLTDCYIWFNSFCCKPTVYANQHYRLWTQYSAIVLEKANLHCYKWLAWVS